MEPLSILDDLRIATPCPASWATMEGDDRVRFCHSCSKHVYDLSGLTAAQAATLIQGAEGRLCVRLYRRRDGTLLTADCPVGLRYAVRRRLLRLATAGVVVFATLRSGLWLYANGTGHPELPPVPTGPGVSLTDWTDWAARALGLKQPFRGGQATMGVICPPPMPSGVQGNASATVAPEEDP
jgi:hypothetical protein